MSTNLSDLRARVDVHAMGRALSTRLSAAAVLAIPASLAIGLLVVGIEGKWPPLRWLDENVAQNLHEQAVAHPLWVRVMLDVSNVGSPLVMRVTVGVVAVVLWIRKARRLALWAGFTMAAGALVDVVIKSAVGRARPSFTDPVAFAPGASFPSGHAFTSTLGAGVLVLLVLPLLPAKGRIAACIVAAAVPLLVGYSRLALGVHWASDVAGGWILGVGLLAATTKAFEAWRRAEGRPDVRPVVEGVAPEETQSAVHAEEVDPVMNAEDVDAPRSRPPA